MFEIINRTPFVVSLIPGLGKDDVAHMTVLAKGTFSIPIPPGPPRIAEQQIPFWPGDEWNGPEPATSSVRFESDACPTKPGTDVVLVGHAYAGARRQATVDVGLRVGKLQKVVRVTGDRIWARAALTWVMSSPPVAFERLPLVYERAFGGVDRSDPAQPSGDDRNPVGTGFAAAARKERLEGLRLPNLEDPRHPIKTWSDRPPVAGFGVVGRGWIPRRSLGGTYDPRFFNGAPADQVAVPHLRGGEPVSLSNCSPDGVLSFELPRIALSITIDWAAGPQAQEVPPVLDTVILDPDERRIVMSWRSTFPCGRRLRQVQRVVVRMARGA